MGPPTPCPRDPNAFPAFQLFFLAIVRLAEPIALTSIFPYAWPLIKHYDVGDPADASFYAGLLISAFSLAEALMGMYWGALSDRIGRKPVLLVGCTGTMLSLLVVGVAPNIWVALAGRVLGGLLNGNIGVIQTMVGELVKNPAHEPRAYSIMPFVWSIGTIIGPAIGGTFADPHASFPRAVPAGSLLDRYPYLLPNLVCALLLLVSIVLGYLLLDETHPEFARRASPAAAAYTSDETPLLATSDALKRPAVDLRAETYGTFGRACGTSSEQSQSEQSLTEGGERDARLALAVAEKPEPRPRTGRGRSDRGKSDGIFSSRILAVVLALSIFSYHSMVYDATLPIFFEDARQPVDAARFSLLRVPGGLGLSMSAVGMVMAVNGAIALFVQAVVFPVAAAWVGVYRLFVAVAVLHPLAYVVVPALVYVPQDMLYPAIYACLSLRNLFSIILYPLLLILVKEATPSPSVLGKVNGMAASAGAACRMVAPPVAGYMYTVGSRIDCTALAWYGGAAVALIGAVQCFSVARPRAEAEEV